METIQFVGNMVCIVTNSVGVRRRVWCNLIYKVRENALRYCKRLQLYKTRRNKGEPGSSITLCVRRTLTACGAGRDAGFEVKMEWKVIRFLSVINVRGGRAGVELARVMRNSLNYRTVATQSS